MIMGNVNSLPNKIDELAALTKNLKTFRECSLLCLTETWLTASIPHANVELPDFSTVRAARDTRACGKRKGGGLALYVNKREFSHAIVLIVYIPPRAEDVEAARDIIHSAVAKLQKHPEALVLISGDFNHATLDNTLAAFHQYVDCNTRGKRTLDLMYANVKDAYRATPLPALGKADHNLVLLKPHYTPRGSHNENMEEMVDCTTDYINFCMDAVVPVRSVRCFANNKPWVTSDIKGLLNQKKKAFKESSSGRRRSSTEGK
ncbi:hypothetical protein L3Q82_007798 [Scortum barcoo]|uniref:Uncharacterized protein n=1 Tax=Scortum barcoo TaxID=214431 RepID=A0ACB8WP87_9TELE|nr:hypothetical protein L3Q82_007798 [Scortum barcoo]